MENYPKNFAEDFLRVHNAYRAIHESPPLLIDDEINEHARKWAETLAQAGELSYSPEKEEYGENVYASYWRNVPYEIKPKDPLESWYADGKYFKYGVEQPKNVEAVRHFTQMVWRETTSMGFGMATGSDGKIYFVCNYSPPGNTPGNFAENVSPPPQIELEDDELPPFESQGIKTIDPRPDVVRSMERLYAVPSEKLRVWSVWLVKIGDVADEWQRWLRSHIDFTTRLTEHLEKAVEVLKAEAMSPEISDVSVVDEKMVDSIEADEEAEKEIKDASTSQMLDEEGAGEEEEAEEPEPEEPPPEEPEPPEEDDKEGDEGVVEDAPEESAAPGVKGEAPNDWPVGKPWKPLGPAEPPEEDAFEKLDLPRSEDEMREFFRKFTHEATVYRSFYKHWNETADLATSDIGCRVVMATYVVQGKRDQLPKQPEPETTGQAETIEAVGEDEEGDVQDRSDAELEALEVQEEDGGEGEEPAAENGQEADDGGSPPPKKPKGKKKRKEAKPAKSKSRKLAFKLDKKFSDSMCPESVESFRDRARAEEPIPYFFYVTAEPDIDIAIEHDDEEVILADTERESILGNYKRVYFNLTDKPCKDGKPWI